MEYTDNYFKSIDEAMEDEAFVGKLAKAESKEQIQALFLQEKGITLEDEAAQAAFDKAENIRNGGELTAEDLENVAGGATRTVANDAVNYANVREKPGLNTKVMFKIPNGEKVYTTGKTKKKDGYVWYEINLAGAYDTGWIAGSLIGY